MSCKYRGRCDIMKKIWIVGLMAFSLFAVSMNSVVADDEITLTDEAGDVYDYIADENTTEKPNIDIRQLTYSKEGRTVTLTLTVEGSIENLGYMDYFRLNFDTDYYEELLLTMNETEFGEYYITISSDYIAYFFIFNNSENIYSVVYVNDEVLIIDDNSDQMEGNFSVTGGKLSISFDFYNDTEDMSEIAAFAMESSYSDDDYTEYSDDISGIFSDGDDTDTDDGDSGETDNNNDSGGLDNSAILIFIAIIAVICIVGVAAVIFVIRRR